ncbi:MAG: 50S ribosomal protein L9 [Anaerolineae bacterium]|nr:50S ribosomal protein L9 [Anaerolineae bacterium]
MKVFLQKDVPGVGKAHQVVNVADGYARNYLMPRGLAVPATVGRVSAAREHAESEDRREERIRERALALATRLADHEIRFKVKAGETGRMYGSITTADIAEKLTQLLSHEFDKRWVVLERPLRDVGHHTVDLKLEAGVRAHIKVYVEADEV